MEPSKRRGGLPLLLGLASPMGHGVLLVAVILAAGPLRQTFWMFREGGSFAWLLLLLVLLLLAALVGLSIWFMHSVRGPSWLLALPSAIMMLAGTASVWITVQKVEGAVQIPALDASLKASIFAQGISETLILHAMGGLFAMSLCSAAAGIVGAVALSRVRAPRLGLSATVAVVAGVLGLLLSILLPVLLGAQAAILGGVCALSGLVAAVVCGVAMDGAAQDDEEAPLIMSDALFAALLLLAGVAACAVQTRAFALHRGFGAVASAGLSPSQRVRILAAAWTEANTVWRVSWVATIAVVLMIAAVLLARPKLTKRALVLGFDRLLVALAVLPLIALIPALQMSHLGMSLARMYERPMPADIELAQVERLERSELGTGITVFLGREQVQVDGESIGAPSMLDSPEGCSRVATRVKDIGSLLRPLLLADKTIGYAKVACLTSAIAQKESEKGEVQLGLAVRVGLGKKEPLPPPFDKVTPLPETMAVEALPNKAGDMDPRFSAWLHVSKTSFRIEWEGERSSRPLTDPRIDEWVKWKTRPARGVILTAEPDLPLEKVISAIATLSHSDHVWLGPTIKDPAERPLRESGSGLGRLPGPGLHRGVRMSETTVDGKLPFEAVIHVLRENLPRIRRCYEAAVRKDSKLEGKLSVKFVIGVGGTVTDVETGESNLVDPVVPSCVVGTIRTMAFLAPETGTASVATAFLFAPGT